MSVSLMQGVWAGVLIGAFWGLVELGRLVEFGLVWGVHLEKEVTGSNWEIGASKSVAYFFGKIHLSIAFLSESSCRTSLSLKY